MLSHGEHLCQTNKGCLKKVVIEGLNASLAQNDDILALLGKHGNIEEIEKYRRCIIVKFSSEIQAAQVVRCQDSFLSPSYNVKLHLAYSGILRRLVGGSSSQKNSRISGAVSRFESTTRRSNKSRIKPSGPRRSGVTSRPPELESRAVALPSPQQQFQSSSQLVASSRNSGKCDVAVMAITHDVVHYAEDVLALLYRRVMEAGDVPRSQTNQKMLKAHLPFPQAKIMVLTSADHIAPCLKDLDEEGILFAISLNNVNMTRNSCTLRILHSTTQQEHRNMPLTEAIDMLLKDFAEYLEAKAIVSSSNVIVSRSESLLPLASKLQQNEQQKVEGISQQQKHLRPHLHHHPQSQQQCHSHAGKEADIPVESSATETIRGLGEPNFQAPSRHVAVLLRMLADSRILSLGELDEIFAFVSQLRSRLTSELTTAATITTGAVRNTDTIVYRQPSSSQSYLNASRGLNLNHNGEMAFAPSLESATSKSFYKKEAPVDGRYSAYRRPRRQKDL